MITYAVYMTLGEGAMMTTLTIMVGVVLVFAYAAANRK